LFTSGGDLGLGLKNLVLFTSLLYSCSSDWSKSIVDGTWC